MTRHLVPSNILKSFGNDIEFVDAPVGKDVRVDILIGLDTYWKLMSSDIISKPGGLVAQKCIFGWVLSGPLPSPPRSMSATAMSIQLLCSNCTDLGNFWDLESVGIKPHETLDVHDPVLAEFKNSIQFSNGRYVVALPWKPVNVRPTLLSNEKMARARLKHLTLRLDKNPDLKFRYHKVFCNMIEEGIIEEIPQYEHYDDTNIFYMPHRPVVKEARKTTKIRPVFDASAKGFNGISLNDCVEAGPSMIPDLPGILLRFRRWKIALTADICKAFLQIQVKREDQDVHRFLWDDQNIIRKMRFVRVPFGNKCSPFLLNATIRYHLSQFSPSCVIEQLFENMYVDDWLSGCDDDVEACSMLREAEAIMSRAGMSLNKWGSNSTQVADLLQREFSDKSIMDESGSFKVLGMLWSASEDSFSFDGAVVPDDLCVTKRVVLSLISRLFDPLGLLSPFLMVAKCIFQELWRLGLAWDEIVPECIQEFFLNWVKGLKLLRSWIIPRSYTGFPRRDNVVCRLQAFGDASQSAYGACVYLNVKLASGVWKSSLVIARAKVAPLKRLSLPRLELLGALLCARLIVYVKREMKLNDNDVDCNCWTDSTVTLAWIQSPPHKWKPFVANRVAEIQSLVSPSQWRHLPGKDNPADLVTRGISAEELLQSELWLKGPNFLCVDKVVEVCGDKSAENVLYINAEQTLKSTVSNHTLVSGASDVSEPLFDLDRWSSVTRAMRVFGWLQRFIHNVRSVKDVRCHGDLSFTELTDAKLKLLKFVQNEEYAHELITIQNEKFVPRTSSLLKLSPFVGDDGLLRVQGRIQFAGLPYDSQHPIIIPKGRLALLLARHTHLRLKHAGVNLMLVELRNQYWIVGARRLCKSVKRECMPCQRLDAPPGAQIMPPLPELRVKQAPPFSVTGLDHGGPLYTCDNIGKKFYILLFTCAVTRALHLELVDALSCETTVFAIRRFIARRGMPSILMSDNAKGFLAARSTLIKHLGSDGPQWKFIAPRAPWWGGWWEILIKSVKSALKRTLGKRSLTRVELETTLLEVESCVNSRPLTFVGDELDSGSPLTPSLFLLGRPSSLKSPINVKDIVVEPSDLNERLELRQQLFHAFWECWVNEYVRNLPPFKGSCGSKGSIKVGSVVLVQGEGTNRLQWPLGVIQAIHPGRDGLVRCVEVKTAKGLFTRPIQRIHNFEMIDDPCVPTLSDVRSIDANNDTVSDVTCPEPPKPVVSRYGRTITKPDRL